MLHVTCCYIYLGRWAVSDSAPRNTGTKRALVVWVSGGTCICRMVATIRVMKPRNSSLPDPASLVPEPVFRHFLVGRVLGEKTRLWGRLHPRTRSKTFFGAPTLISGLTLWMKGVQCSTLRVGFNCVRCPNLVQVVSFKPAPTLLNKGNKHAASNT